jgi:hypothetical protein
VRRSPDPRKRAKRRHFRGFRRRDIMTGCHPPFVLAAPFWR